MERPREEKSKVRYSIEDRLTGQTLHFIAENRPGNLPALRAVQALGKRSGALAAGFQRLCIMSYL